MDVIKLKYTEELVRSAVLSYWKREIGIFFPLVGLLMLMYVSYGIYRGDRSWYVGVIATVTVLSFAMVAAVYIIQLRRALSRFKRMKVPVALLGLSENRLKIESDAGVSEFEYSLITHIWKFEKAWLLFFSAGEFITIPIEGIPLEAMTLIDQRHKASRATQAYQ